jgi:hypothetical protein
MSRFARSLRAGWAAAAIVAAAVWGAGCIRVEQSLTLREDGSAGFEVSYSMAEQTVTQMKALRKLRDQLAAAEGITVTNEWQEAFVHLLLDPSEDALRGELAKYRKYGVTVEKLQVETRNAWRHTKLTLALTDLKALATSDLFKEYGFSLSKTERGDYLFRRGPDKPDTAPPPDFSDPETNRLLVPIVGGFNVMLGVTVPGRILESNATRHSLYTATYVFDFDRDPNAVAAYTRHRMQITFQGRGLNLPEIAK